MPVQFILGLPGLSCRALIEKARELQMPVMISANALSRQRLKAPEPDRPDLKSRMTEAEWDSFLLRTEYTLWNGFSTNSMKNAADLDCHLDSAGYVATALYGGFTFSVDEYMHLAAAFPWKRFSSMDLCVEEKIARDRTAVLDRIAGTVALNNACRIRALDLGINDRFMPVIQGFSHEDYLMCAERMPWIDEYSVIGVGSMCTRHVNGLNGVVHIISVLDRYLPKGVRFHLFGLKSEAAEAVRGLEDRIASVDSQAYGTTARQLANRIRTGGRKARLSVPDTADLFGDVASPKAQPLGNVSFSKTNAFVAGVMEQWATKQVRRLAKPGFVFQDSLLLEGARANPVRGSWEWAERLARNRLRNLVLNGEVEHNDINERWVHEMAGEILSGDADLTNFDDDQWDCDDNSLTALAA
ncbi:hypothetical protein [Azospirillum sp. SYSU D00513]|uniref:deazapurine DNA modification protein DpdA family protein n=1 Tax=Azospirillum sp. SYSU D00513 TaxID=2812561 RepID=UPI001A973C6C|nr:hypothetical protein [Azospirillum sp. SYSU D00513]